MRWDDQIWFLIPKSTDHPGLWILGNLAGMYLFLGLMVLVVR